MSAQPCRVDTHDEHECHRLHLTLVPEPIPGRKLCERCGIRPKKPGKGARLCVECPPLTGNESRTPGMCIACGVSPKERRQGAWYCLECRDLKAEVAKIKRRVKHHRAPCITCGGRKPPGHGIRYCNPCRLKHSSRDGLVMCSGCGENPIRAPRKKYCERCHEMAKVAERRRSRERQRRRRKDDGLNEKRRQDQLARRRRQYREARRRERAQMRKLPCAQLADVITRIIAREEAIEPYLVLAGRDPEAKTLVQRIPARAAAVCARAGVSDKSYYDWRCGKRTQVQFNIADRALTNLGLLWHDVWTPENTDPEEYAIVLEAWGG